MIYLTDGKRHLICYPYSVENLHEMARQLNIKRCWFHKDHYDIPKRRVKEIEEKCIKVTSKLIVIMIRKSKIVLQLDTEGNLIQEFSSCSMAEKKTKIKQPNITACCKGRLKQSGGFKWSYKS